MSAEAAVGGGEGVVGSINGVTTTWLTSVLQRATAIPAGASVASFTHSIIGQGRGHSNVIYKLTVKYTGAGGAPAPSELVLKLPNNDFLDQHIKPRGGEIIAWFNRTYACEVGFYSHQYGKTPDVFCRPFFTASAHAHSCAHQQTSTPAHQHKYTHTRKRMCAHARAANTTSTRTISL